MLRLSLCLSLLSLMLPIHDHGPGAWINQGKMTDPKSGEWCCNEQDCKPEQVREVIGGYLVQTGEIIPASRVIWRSRDGLWWRCHKFINGIQGTRCLIGPPPSM